MKSAEAILKELAQYVRPPRGCSVVLIEWKSNAPPEPNWLAAAGNMTGQTLDRYCEKLSELRKTDPQIDWSNAKIIDGMRRIVVRVSETDD
jgi:hypothetical protein